MAIFNEEFIKNYSNINDDTDATILTEDSIYKNPNEKYSITIDIGYGRESGFLLNPYFKLYNAADFKKATKIARIELLTGKCISHDGLPLLKVNSSIIKWIINTLNAFSTNKKYSDLSVYDAMWKFIYDSADQYSLKHANKINIDDFIIELKRNN